MDMYLEIHSRLSEEEKMKICCALNYEKLSSEACNHLAQNSKFPCRTTTQALVSQQGKHINSQCNTEKENKNKLIKREKEQVLLYAKNLNFPTRNEDLREHLQGMQWRVMELEKVCSKMQTQMVKVIKSKVTSSSSSSTKSLPWLCS